MGSVGADEAVGPGWRVGLEVPADVAGGEAHRTQRTDDQVREVLAHAASVLDHLGERRRHGRESRVEGEVLVDPVDEIEDVLDGGTSCREGRRRVLGERGQAGDEGRRQHQLPQLGLAPPPRHRLAADLPGIGVGRHGKGPHLDLALGDDLEAIVGLVERERRDEVAEEVDVGPLIGGDGRHREPGRRDELTRTGAHEEHRLVVAQRDRLVVLVGGAVPDHVARRRAPRRRRGTGRLGRRGRIGPRRRLGRGH